jgi:uncharacterized protein
VEVAALYVYPVKSCAGTPLAEAEVGSRGIVHDREYMVVDPDGRFLTQRELPRMALIRPTLRPDGLSLAAPGMPPICVPAGTDRGRRRVTVWRDQVDALDQGGPVAAWLTHFLETPCRLVRQPADAVRPVDPAFAPRPTDQVSFTDGFPFLLTSEESLADLNRRLPTPLLMDRFRPSIVVRGCAAPYAEDTWAEVRIGELGFSVVKACARCAITTTDQATAERGVEPLATLATYRRVPRGVLFGQNLVHAGPGRLARGDRVVVLSAAPRPPLS